MEFFKVNLTWCRKKWWKVSSEKPDLLNPCAVRAFTSRFEHKQGVWPAKNTKIVQNRQTNHNRIILSSSNSMIFIFLLNDHMTMKKVYEVKSIFD